jgi:hypothetical protein
MLYQLRSVLPVANRNLVSFQDSSVKKMHKARNAEVAELTIPARSRISETPRIR